MAFPAFPFPLLCLGSDPRYLDFSRRCLMGPLSSSSIPSQSTPLEIVSSYIFQKHGSYPIVLFFQNLHWLPVIVIHS